MTKHRLALLFCCLLLASMWQMDAASEDVDEYEDVELEEEESEDTKEETGIDDKDVFVLTDDNFNETMAKHKFALVEFYAPWCGHCKNLAPHYAKAATTLKEHDSSILIAKVDATAESKLAERFQVKGYPTLKWFIDGKDQDYNGGREEESIVRWVKKKTGPPAETITGVDQLKSMEESNEAFVVGYFSSFDGKDFDAFLSAARVGEDVVYTQTTSKEVAVAAGMRGDKTPSIAMVKNFDGFDREVAHFTESITVPNLENFVVAEKVPLVIEFVEKNQERIFDSGIDTHLLVIQSKAQLDPTADFAKMLRRVATDFKGKLMFVTVDADDESAAEPVVNFFGAEKGKAPLAYGFRMTKNQKYLFDKEFTEENLKSWCKDLVDDKVEQIYKSAPVPENDVEDGVKIVVGTTVEKIVKDPTKDVLLEVYAPWCGHCKQLEPTYKKLAKRFASINSVVIAKMDGTENEHKDIEVSGFPSLFFFPAEKDAEPVNYDDDRSLLSLTKFIKKHAKVPYELPTKKEKKESTEEDEVEDDKTEL